MEHLIKNIEKSIPVLKQFQELLIKWQKAVNLISEKDINDIWKRHILDSAQVYFYIPSEARILVDFGSGGGFPGVVIAILNKCLNGGLNKIYFIESDNKKCIFLQEVCRELKLNNVVILNKRIEAVTDVKADVITARGFASVSKIIQYSIPFLTQKTIFLLPKGENVSEELKELNKKLIVDLIPSVVKAKSYIVKIGGVENE